MKYYLPIKMIKFKNLYFEKVRHKRIYIVSFPLYEVLIKANLHRRKHISSFVELKVEIIVHHNSIWRKFQYDRNTLNLDYGNGYTTVNLLKIIKFEWFLN